MPDSYLILCSYECFEFDLLVFNIIYYSAMLYHQGLENQVNFSFKTFKYSLFHERKSPLTCSICQQIVFWLWPIEGSQAREASEGHHLVNFPFILETL
jgi:hypothetical protein